MKRKISYWLIVLFLVDVAVYAQQNFKPPINSTYFSWHIPTDKYDFTPDGRYVYYFSENSKGTTATIRSANGGWKRSIANPENVSFTRNGLWAVLKAESDSIQLIKLGSELRWIISPVEDVKVYGNFLIYRLKSSPNLLRIKDLTQNLIQNKYLDVQQISDVIQTFMRGDNAQLLVLSEKDGYQQLREFIPGKRTWFLIWTGANLTNLVYSNATRSWFFNAGENSKTLFRWPTSGHQRALPVFNFPEGAEFENESLDGTWIIGKQILRKENTSKKDSMYSGIKVWNFQDLKSPTNGNTPFLEIPSHEWFGLDSKSGRIVDITSIGESIMQQAGDYALVTRVSGEGSGNEFEWNSFSQKKTFLVNIRSGSREELSGNVSLSTYGRFLITDIAGTDSVIFRNLHTNQSKRIYFIQADIPIWFDQDNKVLFNDGYDYWCVNPFDVTKTRCLTNGYGRKNRLRFSMPGHTYDQTEETVLILSARDEKTGANGFFRVSLNAVDTDPKKLHMANCKYNALKIPDKGSIFCFLKNTANAPPSYVFTKDFINFSELSVSDFQRPYNWFSTELHSYRLSENHDVQGILYKPEDFDPNKRYPVIFSYYQDLQDCLHDYYDSGWKMGPLNVGWMASHGYLVFIPDIKNEVNHVNESALRYLMAARDHLKMFPYVDSTKMGIAGHSFGGYETNYFVTKTNVFAAAYSSAGVSNVVSFYGNLPSYVRHGQIAIEPTMWENPQLYIENSPVFRANRVETPILLLGNEGDLVWPQPKEFFNALRRLGKPSWLLQYEGEGHTVRNLSNQIDLTTRVQQFFDHYLKGKPAPDWMITPGSTSTTIDPKNLKLNPGILTPEAQKEVDSLTKRPPITVTF